MADMTASQRRGDKGPRSLEKTKERRRRGKKEKKGSRNLQARD